MLVIRTNIEHCAQLIKQFHQGMYCNKRMHIIKMLSINSHEACKSKQIQLTCEMHAMQEKISVCIDTCEITHDIASLEINIFNVKQRHASG